MAKTNFVDNNGGGMRGTQVLAAFLKSIFYTGGGHKHDGQDDDGHAQKISLTTEVDGVLPLANMASHTHNGTQAHLINLVTHITGKLSLLNQWASIEEFDVTFQGFASSTVAPCIGFLSDTIVVPVFGSITQSVNLRIAKVLMSRFSGTSNAISFAAAAGSIPAPYRPVIGEKAVSTPLLINDEWYSGMVAFDTDGSIRVRKQNGAAADAFAMNVFPTTGQKGLSEVEYTVISYM
jgi:hypothetical protein